jgi:hypothetical protein
MRSFGVTVYDPKRTQVAQSLVDFGKYFDTIFARTRVGGAIPLRPVLVVPEDMSTDGGKRARQSVTLQPEVPGPAALTVGWIDIPGRQAMMRTYNAVASMQRQRFPGRPFDVDRGSYELFQKQFTDLVKTCGLAAQIEDAQEGPASFAGPQSMVGPQSMGGPHAMGGPQSYQQPAGVRGSLGNVETTPAPIIGFGAGVVAIVGLAGFLVGALFGGVAMWLRYAPR